MTSTIHIIGAGMAGLAAAVRLRHLGARVTVYESAPRAGGRCRSYHDPHLDCLIDNGNHLLMSGNTAAMAYLYEIGARHQLAGPEDAAFPFVDAVSKARWTVRPGAGPIPWWILDPQRRVPNTSTLAYLSAVKLLTARAKDTVADRIGTQGALYRNFWEPLVVGAINTDPSRAAAVLMRPVLMETFLKGAAACRPLIARHGLAAALVDPALTLLAAAGVSVHFGARVKGLGFKDGVVASLDVDDTTVPLSRQDTVIMAVPPWIAETLLPGLPVPPAGEPIVNVHYRLPRPAVPKDGVRIVGVIGGLAQWVFAHGDLASVTISAAAGCVEQTAEEISQACWPEVALALDLGNAPQPVSRVVKERRATFAQTPETLAFRPMAQTRYPNLLLAGDWTATGLPATIEGALRSGFSAAALAVSRHQH